MKTDASTIALTKVKARAYSPLSATARIGGRIRNLRKSQGHSQESLSRHIGIDRSYLSKLERGEKSVSLETLDVIAKGLQVKLTELMDID